jgi:20S proteasome subunit alpha 5
MYLTRSEYDRGVNTFSPEGRLVELNSEISVIVHSRRYSNCRFLQVEYASEPVKLGSTLGGIQTKQGSILAIEKRLTSTLLEPSSVEKVMEVDSHIGAAVSGLIGGTLTQRRAKA